MTKTIQIVLEPHERKAIVQAARAERLSISQFAGRLLLEAMEAAGIRIEEPVAKEQLSLLAVENE